MVLTPWGRGDELRERMLDSGPRVDPEAAARNQRERLFGAMVATCAAQGYEATTVGDLLACAGISRRDFYRHFADKEACLLATIEEILAASAERILTRVRAEQSWESRTRAAMQELVDQIVAQPAAASLCLVESYAAGPAASERVDAATARIQELAAQVFASRPETKGMPREASAAMIGALRKIAHARLHRGRQDELPAMLESLLELGFAWRPPPRPLRSQPRRRSSGEGAPARSSWAQEALAEDPAERIVRTTISLVAAKGYGATTIAEIAELAGVSLSTFYAHFDSKALAFDSALYGGRTRLIGVAMPAFKRARSWPESIHALTRASYAFLASEPEFAQVVTEGVLGAGPEALEKHEAALDGAQWPFHEGQELLAPDLDPVAVEAITLTCYALMCEWIKERGAETLLDAAPLATYLALFAFIGADAACEVANGGSYERS